MTDRPPSEQETQKLPAWKRRRLARGSIPPGRKRWPGWGWQIEDTLFTVCVLSIFGLLCVWITFMDRCE